MFLFLGILRPAVLWEYFSYVVIYIIELIHNIMDKLSFEKWYKLNEEEMLISFAESGADRELDFDSELEFDRAYEQYLEE